MIHNLEFLCHKASISSIFLKKLDLHVFLTCRNPNDTNYKFTRGESIECNDVRLSKIDWCIIFFTKKVILCMLFMY